MADHIPHAQWRRVQKRDQHECWWTGGDTPQNVPQHRQGGAGGRRNKHRSANVLVLNSIINGLITSDSDWQAAAWAYGVAVKGFVADVTTVPVLHVARGRWFILEGDDRQEIGGLIAEQMMLTVYGDQWHEWWARAHTSLDARLRSLAGVVR